MDEVAQVQQGKAVTNDEAWDAPASTGSALQLSATAVEEGVPPRESDLTVPAGVPAYTKDGLMTQGRLAYIRQRMGAFGRAADCLLSVHSEHLLHFCRWLTSPVCCV
jgi:hypothetical protein